MPEAATAKKPKDTPATPTDLLDQFEAASPFEAIAMLLWKNRHKNPDMTILVTAQDITGFRDCVNYLKVQPEVRIHRPAGRPASAGMAAKAGRPAIAPREAEPPKPFVVVQLVDAEGNAIKPVENNEADFQRNAVEERRRKVRQNAEATVARAHQELATGDITKGTMDELCDGLLLLAKE